MAKTDNDANADASAQSPLQHTHKPPGFWVLALGTIGVVYGDIGTSPLYAFREAALAATHHGKMVSEPVVLGVLSLIIWALTLVVTVKYVAILLNADNKGEGGTLSLMALAQRAMGNKVMIIPLLAMIGAALFYGDAMITPAVSVLSAIEGFEIITPAFKPYVIPLTLFIIILLFAVQVRGTASVAALFGPIMLVWFLCLAAVGAYHIGDNLDILYAFNPVHAVQFLSGHGIIGLVTLGAVFLAVTGAEALYADLGHFGKKPIQTVWLFLVFPCLILNYLGQGALVLKDAAAIQNPFFLMMPQWAMLPVVILAAVATVIASQAVITGAFSLTRQAIQLGLLPRTEVRFTSEAHAGQVFLPQVNWFILVGVIILVVGFKTSSSLAAAYGIAVTGTMIVTSLLAILVMWKYWQWPLWGVLAMMLPLLALDTIFLGANSLKVLEGGYVPLLLGLALMLIMWTWRRGSLILFNKTRRSEVPLKDLVGSLNKRLPHVVPGTAVFFTSDPESAPTALLHSLKHYKVLHEENVILTIKTSDNPSVPPEDKVHMEPITDHFSRLLLTFGYMETPDVPKALGLARKQGWKFNIMTTSFFLSRRSVRASKNSGMPLWQDKLFISLARNADDASNYFRLPTDRVVEVGSQITV